MAALFALPTLMKFAANPAVWVGVAGLGMAAAIGVQTLRLDHAKADLVVARAAQIDPETRARWADEAVGRQHDLATCQQNSDGLSLALSRQNLAVRDMAAAAAKATSAANTALAATRSAADTAARTAAAVMAVKEGANACASADSLILGSTH